MLALVYMGETGIKKKFLTEIPTEILKTEFPIEILLIETYFVCGYTAVQSLL